MSRWMAIAWILVAACGRLDFDAVVADGARAQDSVHDSVPDDGSRPGDPSTNFVQGNSNGRFGVLADITVSFPGGVTAGGLLVVAYAFDSLTAPMPTVSDARGNSFTLLPLGTFGMKHQGIAYAIANGSGPDMITIAAGVPTRSFFSAWALEYGNRSILDDSSFRAGMSTMAAPLGRSPITTTTDNELVVGLAVGGDILTAGPGFTERAPQDGDVFEEMLAPTVGTFDVTANVPVGSTWLVTAAAFR